MPRDVFETTTEFEAVERERVLPRGTRWHYNADASRVIIPSETDIQGEVYIDPTAKIGAGVTILVEVTSIGKGAVVDRNTVVDHDIGPVEDVKLET